MKVPATVFLSREEEYLLACKARGGDAKARERLIVSHLPFAAKMAARFARWFGFPDLYQEASVALIEAADRFDPEMGNRFATYAFWRMKMHFSNYLICNASQVPRAKSNAGRGEFFAQLRNGTFAQDASMDAQTVDGISLRDRIAKTPDPETDAVEVIDAQWRRRRFEDALSTLSEREQEIIRARWPAHDEDVVPLSELARRYGVSNQRVQQIERNALKKLGAPTVYMHMPARRAA